MRNVRSASKLLALLLASLLVMALLMACQDESEPPGAKSAEPITGPRTISSNIGAPLADYYRPPQSVQDLLNRHDVAFTGTIGAVGEPVDEKAYGWNAEQEALDQARGIPSFRLRVTYYQLQFDEVFLDDGNLRANPRLRLSGDHSRIRPQVGERFLFILGANPDGKSYGVNADWNLIHLDGGPIRNFDGASPGYAGVTDEATLKAAIQTAVPRRVHLPIDQWPIQEKWLANENAPAETPQAPGGPAPGGNGPTGNANN